MSSSKPETTIFLNDSMDVVRTKIMKAHSGGSDCRRTSKIWW